MNSFESRLSVALESPLAGAGKSPVVFLAAVSGGADSTAMLMALAELRRDSGFILHCVHVEHGIRPAEESQGDARAVEALCGRLEVPCRVITVPPGRIAEAARSGGSGIEGAARFFRMRALRREARRVGADWILVAHTRDDLLETLLMRILRGAGPAGLAVMPRTNGRILRPILDMTRKDVLGYLEEKGIPYRTDSTNGDMWFLRNRVRLKLVPFLDNFFPSWRSSLLALAETQSLTAEFLASEAGKRLPWEQIEAGAPAGETSRGKRFSLRIREADFMNAPAILREEAIFAGADLLAVLANTGGKRKRGLLEAAVPRRSAVRRAAGQGGPSAEDLGPVRLRRRNGYIEMTSPVRAKGERGFSLLIKETGIYTLNGKVLGLGKGPDGNGRVELCIQAGISPDGKGSDPAGFSAGVYAAFYAAFHAKLPLFFRNHREGDRIAHGGHKRRFSDILDRKVRSEYTGIITAQDPEGPAAFICFKRDGDLMVISRQDARAGAFNSFLFEVSVKPASLEHVSL